MNCIFVLGESNEMSRPSQCAQVYRRPLQRQETELHRGVYQRRHASGNH